MVKIFIVIFLAITTLSSSWRTRRSVKSDPLWLGNLKDVLSTTWKQNRRLLPKSTESTAVMNVDTLNLVIPSNTKRQIQDNEDEFAKRGNNNFLRMCKINGCSKPNFAKEEAAKIKAQKKAKYVKALQTIQELIDSEEDNQGTQSCPCAENLAAKKCGCSVLRVGPKDTKQDSCNCSAFDFTCKLKCQQHEKKSVVLKLKRCGCGRNDYTCLAQCFNNYVTEQPQSSLRCGCGKTDRMCQDRCLDRDDTVLRSFLRCGCGKTDRICQDRCVENDLMKFPLRCGCGKTDRMCQERCLNPGDLALRSFLRCGCGKTDRICQDRCLDRDDTALKSFLRCGCAKTDRICQDRCIDSDAMKFPLRCGCGKTDRMCQERCLQSDKTAIRNSLRCGCNIADFSCLDRCARGETQESTSAFSNCGCRFNDYVCKAKCDRTKSGWRNPKNRICKCEKYDYNCKKRCSQHKKDLMIKKEDSFDSLIAHVVNNGKRFKINNEVDVVVYDPLNLAHILDGIKFNDHKHTGIQRPVVPILQHDKNEMTNKGAQTILKPSQNVDSKEPTNKRKSQEIDKVLKELQDAKMVEFDIGQIQTEHNEKPQSSDPTKFINMLVDFVTKFKSANSTKLAAYVKTKMSNTKKNIKQGHHRIGSVSNEGRNYQDISWRVQKPNNVNISQKKNGNPLDPLYKVLRSGPDGNVKNRDDGMDFADEVVQSLQDYLYARRKGKEKRVKVDDHDPHHPHQKHSLLPLTKRQKMKRLNGQVGRSHALIKFRRNLPADKVVTYGAPFELDIKGMGQVNLVEAVQLLNG